MNKNYQEIIEAADAERLGLFSETAQRIGTTLQNVEKDFWVCWTLDALFHRLPPDSPRLLFKGGTSLSKGFDLISRFSEDIDITVFRDDIYPGATAEELEKLSKTKRRKCLDEIKGACQEYINGPFLAALNQHGKNTMEAAGQDPSRLKIEPDPNDPDKQSLLIHYPNVTSADDYIAHTVKIESGAKSALDPNEPRTIIPYLYADVPNGDGLKVTDVTTINPKRTFLDKILILHGLATFFEKHENLYGSGQVSRHYYDVYRMVSDPIGMEACADAKLIDDCIRHARTFFYRRDTGLEQVRRGAFSVTPTENMINPLRRDYEKMKIMIFGEVPEFEKILETIAKAEKLLNT